VTPCCLEKFTDVSEQPAGSIFSVYLKLWEVGELKGRRSFYWTSWHHSHNTVLFVISHIFCLWFCVPVHTKNRYTSHHEGSGLKSGRSRWKLWWIKRHWDRSSSEYFGFTCQYHFRLQFILICSSTTDATQSKQFTASLNKALNNRRHIEFVAFLHVTSQSCGAASGPSDRFCTPLL
jgi:hypothetical protein